MAINYIFTGMITDYKQILTKHEGFLLSSYNEYITDEQMSSRTRLCIFAQAYVWLHERLRRRAMLCLHNVQYLYDIARWECRPDASACAEQLRHVHRIMHTASDRPAPLITSPGQSQTASARRPVTTRPKRRESGLWENAADNIPRVGGRAAGEGAKSRSV